MSEAKLEAKEARKALKAQKAEKRQAKREKSFLNKYFHHVDQGSTTGREIMAGLLICILCVCAIFMNMQLITSMMVSGPAASATTADIAANGEIIARQYFLSMLIAFAGSSVIGLVARLPLAQIPSLGLSTLMISALGIGTNLSYQNLLAICFVSSVVYAVIAAVPAVRKAVLNAIPASVRKAAPAALGLLVVFTAMQLTGLVYIGSSSVVNYGVGTSLTRMESFNETVQSFRLFDIATYNSLKYKADSFFPLIQACLLGVLAAFGAFLLLRKTKRPMFHSLMIGTAVYFLLMLFQVIIEQKRGKLNFNLDPLWGRLWMVGSEDAQHLHLETILRSLNIGEVFSKGFDFSAYTEAGGSVALLLVTGCLTFLFANIATVDAMTQGENEKQAGLTMLCNAGANLLAPIVGVSALNVTPLNAAARRDGAKSGLASAVASLGFLLSAFVWLVPFIFSTTSSYDIQFNLYGHYGTSMQLFTESSFIIADGVMAIAGLCLIAGSLKDGLGDTKIDAPFLVTVAAAFFLNNLALGFAAGIVAHTLANIFDRQRSLTLSNIIAAVVSVGFIALTVIL